MNLKNEMYVRTKGGYIHKIESIKQGLIFIYPDINVNYIALDYDDVELYSNTLFGVCKFGDYINGVEYENIVEDILMDHNLERICNDEEVKKVLTKELYNKYAYELEA